MAPHRSFLALTLALPVQRRVLARAHVGFQHLPLTRAHLAQYVLPDADGEEDRFAEGEGARLLVFVAEEDRVGRFVAQEAGIVGGDGGGDEVAGGMEDLREVDLDWCLGGEGGACEG